MAIPMEAPGGNCCALPVTVPLSRPLRLWLQRSRCAASTQPGGTPEASLVEAPLLVCGFRQHGRHSNGFRMLIKRYERQIRRRCVAHVSSRDVLDPHLHSDLHRGVEHPVDTRFQPQYLTDADWIHKAQVIDRCGHYWPPCVPRRRPAATAI